MAEGSVIVEVDQLVRTDYYTTDDDRVPEAATGVLLTVTDPTGATSTPSITNVTTGQYKATKQITAAGLWRLRWTSDHGAQTVYADAHTT